ncbi:ankyrin repeat and zinc finger domain-containing protein 1 isoform X2 [Nycticebus coucang]|uniref:ankyrin repeat and zinc finger domain-containing protein 1 isoform X2 n=1 Tax=Nycticebus coucang TaxID=9470 RepID=UPI00234CBC0F|nr:ankyrin repeat and zinc finger domain-containing protein 1 isoform X2 [Nycticebus coucang]
MASLTFHLRNSNPCDSRSSVGLSGMARPGVLGPSSATHCHPQSVWPMKVGGGDTTANSWLRGGTKGLRRVLGSQRTNSALYVGRGSGASTAGCPLCCSVVTGIVVVLQKSGLGTEDVRAARFLGHLVQLLRAGELLLSNFCSAMLPAPPLASVSLFDLSADAPVFRGLSLVSPASEEALARTLRTSCSGSGERESPERKLLKSPMDISEKLFCSACDQIFQNHQEQREHYKLDWHRFNLKQRLKNKPLLSALDFEKQSSTDDLSSISGSEDSDSASEEDLQTLDEERPEFEKPYRSQGFYPHRVLFQNAQGQFLYAYRCVLGPHQVPRQEAELLLQNLQRGGPRYCVVLMAAAGHFAGAVFQGEVVTHKTFHRYTVRAKRGTAQGLQDARGGAPHSAGANLRRYNEVTLYKDVRDLLAGPDWAKALDEAGTILLRAPRSGRSLFFGGHGAPLKKGDPRLWDIPLVTRRPTFQELQRVLQKLTTLHIHGEDPREAVRLHSPQKHWKTVTVERKKTTKAERRKAPADENETHGQNEESQKHGLSSESEGEDGFQVELEVVELTLGTLDLREFEVLPKRRRKRRNKKERNQDQEAGVNMTLAQQLEEDEPFSQSAQAAAAPLGPSLDDSKSPGQPEPWDVLLAACRAGDIGMLKLQLAAGPEDSGVKSLLSAPLGASGFTLLHAAAAAGRGSVVRLLLEAGADPTVQDSQARPPYTVAADKSTRNEFRRYMEKNPDAYDYKKAQVPGPLTLEMEARQATRKREQKAARRRREEQLREQREREEHEREERQRFAALSDREKRALAAEHRLAAQLGASSPPIPDSTVLNARYGLGTLLELWGIPPRPRSFSLPRLLFLLHTLPSGSSPSGREALFLISYSSTWHQL